MPQHPVFSKHAVAFVQFYRLAVRKEFLEQERFGYELALYVPYLFQQVETERGVLHPGTVVPCNGRYIHPQAGFEYELAGFGVSVALHLILQNRDLHFATRHAGQLSLNARTQLPG